MTDADWLADSLVNQDWNFIKKITYIFDISFKRMRQSLWWFIIFLLKYNHLHKILFNYLYMLYIYNKLYAYVHFKKCI